MSIGLFFGQAVRMFFFCKKKLNSLFFKPASHEKVFSNSEETPMSISCFCGEAVSIVSFQMFLFFKF